MFWSCRCCAPLSTLPCTSIRHGSYLVQKIAGDCKNALFSISGPTVFYQILDLTKLLSPRYMRTSDGSANHFLGIRIPRGHLVIHVASGVECPYKMLEYVPQLNRP